MSKASAAIASVPVTEELAEWRPYQVWASQVRRDDNLTETAQNVATENQRESWDPFSVWKRQVKR